MSTVGPRLRDWIVTFHRWMGLVLCVMFCVWFLSGFVMMYRSYPEVTGADRLRHAEVLDPAQVRVSPQQAYASLQTEDPPTDVRLVMLAGRPVYRLSFGTGQSLVYADTGEPLDEIEPGLAAKIAAAWSRQPAGTAHLDGILRTPDQWTVDGLVRQFGPLMKFSWPNGDQVYVTDTGEVAQYTTREARIAAYFGAIPHWLYFRRLRQRGAVWSRTVIWISGAGSIVSALGLVAGWWIYSPSKRYRSAHGRSHIPYAGQKRWHTTLGLVFGFVAFTWVFSGLLSMDPFPWLSGENPLDDHIDAALHGDTILSGDFASKGPGEALAAAAPALKVKELRLQSFAGEAFYLAVESARHSLIVPVQGGVGVSVRSALDREKIVDLVNRAAEPFRVQEARTVSQYEAYYLDRKDELPLPVLFVRLNDPAGSMYYIDLRTGQIVESYGARQRWNRWLYHGLHSIDLPWLYGHRPAWDIVVLILLAGGSALSVSSVVLAWKLIRRRVTARRRQVYAT